MVLPCTRVVPAEVFSLMTTGCVPRELHLEGGTPSKILLCRDRPTQFVGELSEIAIATRSGWTLVNSQAALKSSESGGPSLQRWLLLLLLQSLRCNALVRRHSWHVLIQDRLGMVMTLRGYPGSLKTT